MIALYDRSIQARPPTGHSSEETTQLYGVNIITSQGGATQTSFDHPIQEVTALWCVFAITSQGGATQTSVDHPIQEATALWCVFAITSQGGATQTSFDPPIQEATARWYTADNKTNMTVGLPSQTPHPPEETTSSMVYLMITVSLCR